MKSGAKVSVILACAVVAAQFFVGGSSPASGQEPDAKARMEQLLSAIKASKNATLVIYSAYPTFPPVVRRFMADFPDVKAVHEVASGATLAARLQAERQSGNYSADIAISAPVDLIALERQKFFQTYMPKSADALPHDLKSSSSAIGVPFRTLFTLTYNTNLLPTKDTPASLDEALNEKWKGRIGYAAPTGANAFDICTGTLWYNHMITEAQLKKLHELGKGLPQNTQVVTDVAQGRLVMGLWGPSQTAYRLQLDKAPVESKFLGDMAALFGPGAALLANSPHSDAGKLFLEWLYSPSGQAAIVEEMGSYGTMPGAPSPKGQPDTSSYKVKDIPLDEAVDVLARYREVTKAIWTN